MLHMTRGHALQLGVFLAFAVHALQSATLPRRPGSLWAWARRQAAYEQGVEDVNAPYRSDGFLVRELIVMPISGDFASSSQHPLHGRLEHSDKCSFPASIGRDIYRRPFEVPWIFELTRVPALARPAASLERMPSVGVPNAASSVSRIYTSPLDFRSPENYVFMPSWAMRALRVSPQDRLRARFVRLQLSSKIVLQPLNITWDTVFMSPSKVSDRRDPTSILEQQLNKYSALTAGTVVTLKIEGNEYSFLVKETYGETGASVYGVRVQDADVSVVIDRSQLDRLKATITGGQASPAATVATDSEAKRGASGSSVGAADRDDIFI